MSISSIIAAATLGLSANTYTPSPIDRRYGSRNKARKLCERGDHLWRPDRLLTLTRAGASDRGAFCCHCARCGKKEIVTMKVARGSYPSALRV